MMSYDFGMAFVEAQGASLMLVDSFGRTMQQTPTVEQNIEILRDEISHNLIHGQTFVRNFRKYYPEIYTEITTRQAVQTLLNAEKAKVEELLESGRIEYTEAEKMLESVTERMKRIQKLG